MSSNFKWPTPDWAHADDKARTRFLLALATAYLSDRATIQTLADEISLNPSKLYSARDRGQVTPEIAIAIERRFGPELFPRGAFRPDIYPE